MRRALANAVIVAGLMMPLCLYGQPHGAHGPSGGFHGSFHAAAPVARMHLPPRPVRMTPHANYRWNLNFPPVTGTSLINPAQASCLLNPSYSGSPYCRQYFGGRPSLGFEPVYPYWMPTAGYDNEEPAASAPEPEQDAGLAAQVDNLTAEVETMRQDQAMRESRGPSAPPPAAYEEKPPTTMFVYRDGHQVEVQNYAIMGQTLYVFAGQGTRRVPLTDLDLPATERANSERGVEFVPPAGK